MNAWLERNGLGIGLLLGVGLILISIAFAAQGNAVFGGVVFAGGLLLVALAVAPGVVERFKLGNLEVVTRQILREVGHSQPEKEVIAREAEAAIEANPPRSVAEAVRAIATVVAAPKARRGQTGVEVVRLSLLLQSRYRTVAVVIDSPAVTVSKKTTPTVAFERSVGREGRQLEYRAYVDAAERYLIELLVAPVDGSILTLSRLSLDIGADAELGPIRAHLEVQDASGTTRVDRLAALGVVDDLGWDDRELPILRAIDRLATGRGGPSWKEIAGTVALPPQQIQIALRRLWDAGYIGGVDVSTFGSTGFELMNVTLLAPGLRAIGSWPAGKGEDEALSAKIR